MSAVTHYADDSEGIEFIDSLTLAPVPSLCGDGEDGDLMSWFADDVTCGHCKALLDPSASGSEGP